MSDNRSIQRLDQQGQRAGAIMTPQGPAIIQVIDIPSGGLGTPMGAGIGGMPPRKVGGINILGAILRRWWLVLGVAMLIGVAGIYVANNFIKPMYIGHAKVSWIDKSADGQAMARLVTQATDVLTSRDIPLLVAKQAAEDLANGKETASTRAFGDLVKGRDINDPSVQIDVVRKMKEAAVAEVFRPTQVVDIQAMRKDPQGCADAANAFATAFVKYCQEQMKGDLGAQITQLEQNCKDALSTKGALTKTRTELAVQYNFDRDSKEYESKLGLVAKISEEQLQGRVTLAAAEAKLKAMENGGERRPDQELQSLDLVEAEKQKDNVLQTYNQQLVSALAKLEEERTLKKDEHPDVRALRTQVDRMKAQVLQREAEISSIIRRRIDERFRLTDAKSVAEARDAVNAAQTKLKELNDQLAVMDKRSKELVWVKSQIEALDNQIALVVQDYNTSYTALQEAKKLDTTLTNNSGIRIAELADPPLMPDQDKRMKVKAAGMVGGLFLGMLLALLVDRFDKRLRDPRDIEPLLGAPLLGTIPRIGELKRVKGEQARNLIAEEFRIIRTQLLFGNPQLQHKVIAITSPQPGDGKTSLAVNLAISIAKAGRRVLLVDGDLRKPDIHRIFNISDSPGFAEVIAGSHEPGAVIRKSDIDGLEVLPAGTPITRPSELLSRPEVSRVLSALGEVYDHIVIDTAPLLPVSDTHVLAGLVDAVMCSFNADVDRNTVILVQDILRRSHANVIGTVMNQVKYKQSGSYQRGKSAYSSYYSSSRVPNPNNLPGKPDQGVATLTKH